MFGNINVWIKIEKIVKMATFAKLFFLFPIWKEGKGQETPLYS